MSLPSPQDLTEGMIVRAFESNLGGVGSDVQPPPYALEDRSDEDNCNADANSSSVGSSDFISSTDEEELADLVAALATGGNRGTPTYPRPVPRGEFVSLRRELDPFSMAYHPDSEDETSSEPSRSGLLGEDNQLRPVDDHGMPNNSTEQIADPETEEDEEVGVPLYRCRSRPVYLDIQNLPPMVLEKGSSSRDKRPGTGAKLPGSYRQRGSGGPRGNGRHRGPSPYPVEYTSFPPYNRPSGDGINAAIAENRTRWGLGLNGYPWSEPSCFKPFRVWANRSGSTLQVNETSTETKTSFVQKTITSISGCIFGAEDEEPGGGLRVDSPGQPVIPSRPRQSLSYGAASLSRSHERTTVEATGSRHVTFPDVPVNTPGWRGTHRDSAEPNEFDANFKELSHET